MAGRDLFATQPTPGRDLFAATTPSPAPEAQLPQVAQPSASVARPSLSDLFAKYTSGGLNPTQMEAFEELARRQFSGKTVGISSEVPSVQRDTGENVTLQEMVEPVATLATGAIAEPIAGLAGIAAGVLPGEEGQAAQAVEATREALTYAPKTERGKEALSSVGKFIEPVAKFIGGIETGLGDTVYDQTGSAALASAAATIPTALMEASGLAFGRGALRSSRSAKRLLNEGKIAREITEAVPTIEQLKDTSRAVYKEIDDMGVSVDSNAYNNLVNKIGADARKAGLDPDITPKAQKSLNRFEELVDQDVTLSELDTLRKVAQNAASSIEPAEAALGSRMIGLVDDFLDKSDVTSLNMPKHIDSKNVGKRYRIARDMWGRARKSELVQEAFEKARNQASGFENGVRTQFRAILNNKKKSRYFSRDELSAIKKVVRGDKKQNIAKLIGRLGFSEGGATNVIGGALGIGAGAAIGGTPGALIVPIIGQLSRKLAQRMTAKGAEFADQVIRAGKNARKITDAYLKNTPKAQRSSRELSELLTMNDIDLVDLPRSELVNNAVTLANQRRAELSGAIAASADTQSEVDNE